MANIRKHVIGVQDKKVTDFKFPQALIAFLVVKLCTGVPILRMPDQYSSFLQQRSVILDQMAALDRMERGRLFEQFFKGQKDGQSVTWGPYYVLQRRHGDKVLKERVPAERLPTLQADIQHHQQFQELAERYAQITEEMTRLQDADPELKKKPKLSKPTNFRKPRRS